MFMPYDRASELYHYGVLNMHWYVRRFQPYPKGYKGEGKFVGKKSKSKDAIKREDLRRRKKNAEVEADTYAAEQLAKAKKIAAKRTADEASRAAKVAKSDAKARLAQNKANVAKAKADVQSNKLRQGKGYGLFKTPYGKRKAIMSGNPKKVKRYASLMSNEEYKAAIERCNYANDMAISDLKRASAIGQTIASGLSSLAGSATSIISLQNSITDVHNALSKAGTKWKKWGEKEKSTTAKDLISSVTAYKGLLGFATSTGVDPFTNKSLGPVSSDWEKEFMKLHPFKIYASGEGSKK